MTPVASAMQAPTIEGGGSEALPPIRAVACPQIGGARSVAGQGVHKGNVGTAHLGSELRVRPGEQAKVEGTAEGFSEV